MTAVNQLSIFLRGYGLFVAVSGFENQMKNVLSLEPDPISMFFDALKQKMTNISTKSVDFLG